MEIYNEGLASQHTSVESSVLSLSNSFLSCASMVLIAFLQCEQVGGDM